MISYENATLMKNLGFRQPEHFRVGQFWHSLNKGLLLVAEVDVDEVVAVQVGFYDRIYLSPDAIDGLAYAPTVADILSQMGGYVTDGANILRVRGGIVEHTVFGWATLEEAAVLAWFSTKEGPASPKNGIYADSDQSGKGKLLLTVHPDGLSFLNGDEISYADRNLLILENDLLFIENCKEAQCFWVPDSRIDGVLTEAGPRLGFVFQDPDEPMGIYTVSVDPAFDTPSQGFAGTYTPTPKICSGCRFYGPHTQMCENTDSPYFTTEPDNTCDKWEQSL